MLSLVPVVSASVKAECILIFSLFCLSPLGPMGTVVPLPPEEFQDLVAASYACFLL